MFRRLVFFLFFFLLPSFSIGQVVNIPDSIFKSRLVANTAINLNGDGEIQLAEAAVFKDSIQVSGIGIADLTGMEAFISLSYLSCGANELTGIDVTSNTALTYLNCAGNRLGGIDVSPNIALEYLNVSFDSILTLDLSQNTALTLLRCNASYLTDLNTSDNSPII
jgi:hypothetical protein